MNNWALVVKHIQQIAAVEHGYTLVEVTNFDTEYAVCLQKRDCEHLIVTTVDLFFSWWFYSFLGRWPELNVCRPKTITELKAKATSKESVDKYFFELENKVLNKYGLKSKPEYIYNVDEKGVTRCHSPPYISASSESNPTVITSEKSKNTTVLSCGNALG